MAGEGDAKARFPRQQVGDGQKHGYLGDVETYDPAVEAPGHTNAATVASERPAGKKAPTTETGGTIGVVTDADVQAAG